MSELFGESHRKIQDAYDTRRMADRIIELACQAEFDDEHKGFIESHDMFFLASVDANGSPTVSYKGSNSGNANFQAVVAGGRDYHASDARALGAGCGLGQGDGWLFGVDHRAD